MTVYKYNISGEVTKLPRGAKVLKVGYQGQDLCLWAEVDTKVDIMEQRLFKILPTGVEADLTRYTFIDTVFIDWMVFHIYIKD